MESRDVEDARGGEGLGVESSAKRLGQSQDDRRHREAQGLHGWVRAILGKARSPHARWPDHVQHMTLPLATLEAYHADEQQQRRLKPSEWYEPGSAARYPDPRDRFQLQFHKSRHKVRMLV